MRAKGMGVVVKTLEAIFGVPPDEETSVVQVFHVRGALVAEIRLRNGRIAVDLLDSETGDGDPLPADELAEIVRLAEARLRSWEGTRRNACEGDADGREEEGSP